MQRSREPLRAGRPAMDRAVGAGRRRRRPSRQTPAAGANRVLSAPAECLIHSPVWWQQINYPVELLSVLRRRRVGGGGGPTPLAVGLQLPVPAPGSPVPSPACDGSAALVPPWQHVRTAATALRARPGTPAEGRGRNSVSLKQRRLNIYSSHINNDRLAVSRKLSASRRTIKTGAAALSAPIAQRHGRSCLFSSDFEWKENIFNG